MTAASIELQGLDRSNENRYVKVPEAAQENSPLRLGFDQRVYLMEELRGASEAFKFLIQIERMGGFNYFDEREANEFVSFPVIVRVFKCQLASRRDEFAKGAIDLTVEGFFHRINSSFHAGVESYRSLSLNG